MRALLHALALLPAPCVHSLTVLACLLLALQFADELQELVPQRPHVLRREPGLQHLLIAGPSDLSLVCKSLACSSCRHVGVSQHVVTRRQLCCGGLPRAYRPQSEPFTCWGMSACLSFSLSSQQSAQAWPDWVGARKVQGSPDAQQCLQIVVQLLGWYSVCGPVRVTVQEALFSHPAAQQAPAWRLPDDCSLF